MVDLVAEDEERGFAKVFHGQKRIEFGFGFSQAFMIFCVDKEDDSRNFREVVSPKSAGCQNTLV